MTTIRFERDGVIGNIVLANPPFNRLDQRFTEALRIAVHQASVSDIRVLVVRAEGPHFSFGGEVREWPGKDVNWFRTFVADVNASYRAIEMLKIPTVAVVQGIAFGGGFELALACDFLVAAENAIFRCVEVTTAMLPIAGPCSGSPSALDALAHRDLPCLVSRFPDAKQARSELRRMWYLRTSFQRPRLHWPGNSRQDRPDRTQRRARCSRRGRAEGSPPRTLSCSTSR